MASLSNVASCEEDNNNGGLRKHRSNSDVSWQRSHLLAEAWVQGKGKEAYRSFSNFTRRTTSSSSSPDDELANVLPDLVIPRIAIINASNFESNASSLNINDERFNSEGRLFGGGGISPIRRRSSGETASASTSALEVSDVMSSTAKLEEEEAYETTDVEFKLLTQSMEELCRGVARDVDDEQQKAKAIVAGFCSGDCELINCQSIIKCSSPEGEATRVKFAEESTGAIIVDGLHHHHTSKKSTRSNSIQSQQEYQEGKLYKTREITEKCKAKVAAGRKKRCQPCSCCALS